MATRLPPETTLEDGTLKCAKLLALIDSFTDDWQLAAAGSSLLALSEEVGWFYGKAYTGHSISKRDGIWLLVLRASDRTGHYVCFFSGATQNAAFAGFAYAVKEDLITWKEDRYK